MKKITELTNTVPIDKQYSIVRIMNARLGMKFKNYEQYLKYVFKLREKCNV